jgi:hypothetical protein
MLAERALPARDDVVGWRLSELVRAGYPERLAFLIARRSEGPEKIDLHEAVDLVEHGCEPATAVQILR